MTAPQLPPGFPLCWPDDWKRSRARGRSTYKVTMDDARQRAEKSLSQMRIRRFVFTTNMPLRLDGKPMASARPPTDPGVALWWIEGSAQRVIACDQYETVRENMRAIGMALEALRALERAGASQILARTMESFAVPALPAGRPWFCDELGLDHWPVTDDEMSAAYRARVKVVHPDQNNGDSSRWYEFNRAYRAAVDARA